MGARVALLAELGVSSIGNDASAVQVIRLLEDRVGGVEITILSREPVGAATTFGRSTLDARARWSYHGPWHDSGVAKGVRLVLDLGYLVRLAGRFDAIVVPGTGALEAGQGGLPRGTLLSLLVAGVAAWARAVPYVWLAIGGSRYTRAITRWAVRAAASTATVRSYRDRETREAVGATGTDISDDVLMEDVVTAWADVPLGASEEDREVVVVSVIDVPSARGGARATGEEHSRYEQEMARFLARLLDRGEQVRMVVSDAADVAVAQRVVREVTGAGSPGVVEIRVPHDFEELLRDLAGVRAVVGSRFHILVAAALNRVPFVTVEHADKVRVLSDDVGVGAYRVHAHGFRCDELLEAYDSLVGKRDALTCDLDTWAHGARDCTLRGVDEVFARLERTGAIS